MRKKKQKYFYSNGAFSMTIEEGAQMMEEGVRRRKGKSITDLPPMKEMLDRLPYNMGWYDGYYGYAKAHGINTDT